MPQANSLERAFTVLTYLLSSQQFNHTDNQKPTCHKFEGALNNIETAINFMEKYEYTLDTVSSSIFEIQIDLQSREPEITKMNPYECADETVGKLFCEDNRYSKHLLLIGRGHTPMSHDLYRKLLDGVPCDKICIVSGTDFFIGGNNLLQLIRNKQFEMLFVYIDANDMEHFHYVPEFQFDGKKLQITRSRSSMTDVSLKDLIKNIKFKSWKIFLHKK